MPVADREEVFEVTIPAGTPKTVPVAVKTSFNPGTVIEAELVIPDGAVGLAGVRVSQDGTQIWPITKGSWFAGNNERIVRQIYNWPNSGRLEVEGYNEDIYDHTFSLRLAVREIAVGAEQPTQAAPTELTTTPTGGIATNPEPEQQAPPPPPPPEGETPPPPADETEPPPPAEGATPSEPPPAEGAAPSEPPPAEGAEGENEPPGELQVATPGGEPQPTTEYPGPRSRTRKVKQKVHKPPATGLHEARDSVSGHPELHHGVSVAVNLIMRQYPRLQITSTTGGHHAPGSLHYLGEAADLATNDTTYMKQAADWIKTHLGRYLTEGIHNPGLSIKDGKDVATSFWGQTTWDEHQNHIHIGVAPPQEDSLLKANKPTEATVTKNVVEHPHKRKPTARKPKAQATHKRTPTAHGKQDKVKNKRQAATDERRKQAEQKRAEHKKQAEQRRNEHQQQAQQRKQQRQAAKQQHRAVKAQAKHDLGGGGESKRTPAHKEEHQKRHR